MSRSVAPWFGLWLASVVCLASLNGAAAGAELDSPAADSRPAADPWKAASLYAGLGLLNSGLASLNPKVVGGVMVLTTPLAFAEGSGTREAGNWVGSAGYLALGMYNLNAFGDSYSRRLVFERNLLGWQLLGGSIWLAEKLDAPPAVQQPLAHLALAPLPRGGVLLTYHVNF